MSHKNHKGFGFSPFLFAIVAVLFFGSAFLVHAGEVTLLWDANSEADVTGYQVHYGVSSGHYDQAINVGNKTTATVSNLTGGTTYFFAVTAYNTAGLESLPSNEVFKQVASEVPSQPPVVSLTSPKPGSSFTTRTKITLTSTASAPGGSIAKVEFYVGGAKVGEDKKAPYQVAWTPSQAGTYQLFAKAIDNKGATASSEAVSVQITNHGTGGGKKTSSTFTTLIASTDPAMAYAGAATVTTTSDGTYSGKIKHGGVTYSVKGRLDANGSATKVIPRKGKTPLILTLKTDESTPGELSGSIADGSTSADFVAKKTAGAGEQSTRSAGRWTVLLPTGEAVSGDTSHPQGTGFGTLVINKKGSARLTGTLADGTPIAQGGQLSEAGALSLYVPLYGKKGTFAGVVQFPASNEDPKVLSGSAEWSKPAGLKKQKFYPAGFRLPLDIAGEPALGAGGTGSTLPPRDGKTALELTLFGGDLPTPLAKRITAAGNGSIQLIPGDERLKFQLRPNGRFSGSFLDGTAAERRRFVGTLLPTRGVGAGFFLGGNESGGVFLKSVE